MIFDRAAEILENVLDSDTKTNRAARLLGLAIWAWVVTVVGVVTIVALLMTSASWWAIVASMVGVTAATRGGVAVARRRLQQAPIDLPDPRGARKL